MAREEDALHEAAQYADRAVVAAGLTGDSALQGLVLLGRAEISLARQDLAAARGDHEAARTLAQRSGDAVGCAEADRMAGRIALAGGQAEEALRLARLGYREANRLEAVQLAGECAELCTRASRELLHSGWVARYRATARRHYSALGARPALRRLAADGQR